MPSQCRSIIAAKRLERFESLPLERGTPVLEEPARPALAVVAPQLPERLLEQVRRVQALVRGQEELQALLACERQVLAMRQERVLLPLDEAPVGAGQPRGLRLAHGVQRVAEVPQDVEFVEQDARPRRVALRGACGTVSTCP